jgi:hypothetical protein
MYTRPCYPTTSPHTIPRMVWCPRCDISAQGTRYSRVRRSETPHVTCGFNGDLPIERDDCGNTQPPVAMRTWQVTTVDQADIPMSGVCMRAEMFVDRFLNNIVWSCSVLHGSLWLSPWLHSSLLQQYCLFVASPQVGCLHTKFPWFRCSWSRYLGHTITAPSYNTEFFPKVIVSMHCGYQVLRCRSKSGHALHDFMSHNASDRLALSHLGKSVPVVESFSNQPW